MQEAPLIAGNTAHIAESNQHCRKHTHCRKHCPHSRKQPAPHKPNNFTIIAPLCQNTFRFYSNDQASPQHFLQRLPEINFYAKTPKNVPQNASSCKNISKHLKTSPRMLLAAKTSQNISRHPPECFFCKNISKHLKTSPRMLFSAKTSQNISRHPPECFYPQASTASPEAYRDILPDRWKKNEQDQ